MIQFLDGRFCVRVGRVDRDNCVLTRHFNALSFWSVMAVRLWRRALRSVIWRHASHTPILTTEEEVQANLG